MDHLINVMYWYWFFQENMDSIILLNYPDTNTLSTNLYEDRIAYDWFLILCFFDFFF